MTGAGQPTTAAGAAREVSCGLRALAIEWANRHLLNPPTKLALRLGVAPRAFALLETRGRRTQRLRHTVVGNGLVGGEFWLISQRGRRSPYVLNALADPRVRVKIGRRWYHGRAELVRDDDWEARLEWIGRALGRLRRADARILRWFVRELGTEPVVVRIDLEERA